MNEKDSDLQEKNADNLKRPATPNDCATRKVRLRFNSSEFRKQIRGEQRMQALQHFLQLLNEASKHDVILTYLEGGGSVLEILRLIEGEFGVAPVLIFDIVNRILLQISTKLPQYHNSAYDACRYILNNFITLINQMISLSSSSKERLVVLKLLTTMVTCSVVLAKDILLHVNFNPTKLQLLTKASEGKTEVRSAFIHFITAFLVDGHFPTLSILLEKRGLMTSIIQGLRFDKADVVVLVLTAMRTHILENTAVTKTAKMRTFSTPVVRDIVNLYNWKGPGGLVDQKNKTKTSVIDEVEKSKVSEAVHAFLLVLCTSHKLGVIFKDPMVGLGKRQNSLMYTVLESLERPWEHSYAGDLVIKICKACPDLVRTMWTSLKPFLEPRWTTQWLKAIQFANQLLNELHPDSLESNNLNVLQLTQVITILASPLPVLKILIPENRTYEQPSIKLNVMALILKMLESVENFLKVSSSEILKSNLANYVEKNFPDVELILSDWEKSDSDSSVSDYLNVALDLLEKYKTVAPKMLHENSLSVDMNVFISKIDPLEESLKIKAISFLIGLEPAQFRPKSDLFQSVVTLSMEVYYNSKDLKVLNMFHLLLKNTGIFDDVETEIDFWINGILNVKKYDNCIPDFFYNLVRKVDENAAEYNKKMFGFQNANFSLLVMCLTDFQTDFSKTIKNYLAFVFLHIFHMQINATSFIEIVNNLKNVFPTALAAYIESWSNSEVVILETSKGQLLEQFSKFSKDFLEGSLEDYYDDVYPNRKLNFLQALIFYLSNLIKTNSLTANQKKNCQKFFGNLFDENVFQNESHLKTILGNPLFLQNVAFQSSDDFFSKLTVDVIRRVDNPNLDTYLANIRERILSNILKIFKKSHKYQNVSISRELVETVTLDFEHCRKLISKFVSCYDNKNFFQVISYCLNRMSELGENDTLDPLSHEIIEELSNFLIVLIKNDVPNLNQFSLSFRNYLRVFPQSHEKMKTELFESLIKMKEFNKDNLALCEFLLDRTDCWSVFVENIDEICSKKGFILALLDVVIRKNNDDEFLETIFRKLENHIIKALQKPHKAGQHFQNRYKSVGILIKKFMKPDDFGTQIQKFETTELFHVYLLKQIFDKIEKDPKIFTNIIMTFIHLLIQQIKQNRENLVEIGEIFYEFLDENQNFDVILSKNETFKTFCKLCLKHGVSGELILMKILAQIVQFCVEDDAKLIFEMLMSHSKFFDVILGDSQKNELLDLWLSICTKWPQFMERNHVPILLSSYRATKSELTTLKLLKMYENNASQTKFFDFKPFLWGRAAASHYSVRSDFQKVLWREPKMADVLNNLHFGTIISTINEPTGENSYDLDYVLPLFSHLLSPENPVAPYKFTKSGALALTLVGLRGDKSQRLATCHVLQRFYFHLEAREKGKDDLLWLRFIQAICKGIVVFDDFEINNFVGVFLARSALILAQPTHVMYVPLTQYLAAKDSLDFSTIPELYTFLHSPHVDFRDHQQFILEVLRDGLCNENDFTVLLKSMGFKLISELFSSSVCDPQNKILILDVFERCCRIEFGVKILCGSLSFLAQIFTLVLREGEDGVIFAKLLEILSRIVDVDKDKHRNFTIFLNLTTFLENEHRFQIIKESKSLDSFMKILLVIFQRFPEFFNDAFLVTLKKLNSKFCKYFVKT